MSVIQEVPQIHSLRFVLHFRGHLLLLLFLWVAHFRGIYLAASAFQRLIKLGLLIALLLRGGRRRVLIKESGELGC